VSIFVAIGVHVNGHYVKHDDIYYGESVQTNIVKFADYTYRDLYDKLRSYVENVEYGLPDDKINGKISLTACPECEFLHVKWIFMGACEYESVKMYTDGWDVDAALCKEPEEVD